MVLTEKSRPFFRPGVEYREGELVVFVRPSAPNWIGLDERGKEILKAFDGSRTVGEVVSDYARRNDLEWVRAYQDVMTVAGDALRYRFLDEREEEEEIPYRGRRAWVQDAPLSELWLHTNNSCNLSCTHCLVSSGPAGEKGLPTDRWLDVIRQARSLGTKRFFITGGEPFLRRDLPDLLEEILSDPEAEAAVLTNGIPLKGALMERLKRLDRDRFRLQISIDGSNAETNDAIRGEGSFMRIVEGIRNAVDAGVHVTLTSVVTAKNLDDIPRVTRLAGELGAFAHHLLWIHKRGRADDALVPTVPEIVAVVRECRRIGDELGVIVDNHEALKGRLKLPPYTRRDLSVAGVNSLCVYCDGTVYPSAAMANVEALRCGDVTESSLEEIWKKSRVTEEFRDATVERKEDCRACPLKFLCGGGDIEHAYFHRGSILAPDPYCELHKEMYRDAFFDLVRERRRVCANGNAGFKTPVVFTGMGDGGVHCAAVEEFPRGDGGVSFTTTHSECVVSFDFDAPRKKVRLFYGDAAEEPQQDLCCPVRPDPEDLKHIPKEVVERFYGCGSPVQDAAIRPGETTLDLGSGAGIDVFIAAKKVGPEGRAIGVDMTDRMLEEARRCRPIVARNLGYDNVEFHKGFLEEVPLEDASVDVVTSNCVVNLSPDKMRVFNEIWRVLKDHGRMVVADIVSEKEVPPHQRKDPRLWGECISGALTEEEFLAMLERAGFYGIEVLKKSFWREVESYRFYSVTVRAYKFAKKGDCVYRGQWAIYRGPFKGIADEEGHWFPRNIPVEVCSDTAAKLSHPPYADSFVVLEGNETDFKACCVGSDEKSSSAGSSCCC